MSEIKIETKFVDGQLNGQYGYVNIQREQSSLRLRFGQNIGRYVRHKRDLCMYWHQEPTNISHKPE